MDESRALTVQETMDIATHFAKSQLFPKTQAEQAFVKIMAGQELGIPPFAAMTGIHVIQGKATLGAGIIASRIKASGKYDYHISHLDNHGCELIFYENGQQRGCSSFTDADAEAAGVLSKDNWKRFPRNMYFARAISNGARWYCPDVSSGPIYTPDELGADVDVIDVTPKASNSQREQLLDDVDAIAEKHHGPMAGYAAKHMDDDKFVDPAVVEPEPSKPESEQSEGKPPKAQPESEMEAEPWYKSQTARVHNWLNNNYGLNIDTLHDHDVHLRQFKTLEDFLEWGRVGCPKIREAIDGVAQSDDHADAVEQEALEQEALEQEALEQEDLPF